MFDLDIPGLPARKVSDLEFNFNLLIYGKPDVGKTRLAASAWEVPELHPIIDLDIEKGSNTFRHIYPDLPVLSIRTWEDTKKSITALRNAKQRPKTVIVDNISESAHQNMKHIMYTRKGGDDMATPEYKEFNLATKHILELVRVLRDMEDCNIIFTAWRRVDIDERTKMSLIKPNFSPAIAEIVPGLLDEVFYYYFEEVETDGTKKLVRTLLTSSTANVVAKDRSGNLPKKMRDPNMKDIYYTIVGEGKNAKADND